jgi:hypothetical protein
MAIHSDVCVERIVEMVEADENSGFCLACGAEAYGIEPDTRKAICEECDAPKVYGAEELLLMTVGRVR